MEQISIETAVIGILFFTAGSLIGHVIGIMIAEKLYNFLNKQK